LSDLLTAAARVRDLAKARGLMIATAESCTGGLIAATLTEIAGSSAAFSRGYVTYSNAAKTEMLGVPAALIEAHGAVSEEVARAMAEGAIVSADIAIAVTGIAGPGGATPGKPVGLVHFGLAMRGRPTRTEDHIFEGDRTAVRRATVDQALTMLINVLTAS
jgi:nicotinamide-nucleotide amidase